MVHLLKLHNVSEGYAMIRQYLHHGRNGAHVPYNVGEGLNHDVGHAKNKILKQVHTCVWVKLRKIKTVRRKCVLVFGESGHYGPSVREVATRGKHFD
jgi:hypothetical protein